MPDASQAASARADLTAATADEIAEALRYALRFDERGKPHRGGGDLIATIAAEHLAEHLRRAGFLVMKAPPARAHSTG
jgi:hypothetical protein